MKGQTFILIGRSGCGKGTQAEAIKAHVAALEAKYNPHSPRSLYYLYTGQAFRELVKGTLPTQVLARKVLEVGGLQPEFLTVYLWSRALIENFNGTDHLMIDGTPRKLHEAGALHSIFDFYGREPGHVVYINISAEEARKRLLARKRDDDTEDSITKRLGWFDSDVKPAIEYYRLSPHYRFHEVNGEQAPELVSKEIIEKLNLEAGYGRV